jgi:ribose transport system ATP-binding protein
MADSASILRVREVSKSFGGSRVLDSVSLDIGKNQIVGIVGENGAGKSTLFNIISGILPPDAGRIELYGEPIAPTSYREACRLGISRVFQEQALIPNIRVYENLLLSHEGLFARGGQLLDSERMIKTAEAIVAAAGLEIDVRRLTSDYGFSKRQLIEIARACLVPTHVLGIDYPIVLLDEPTSTLEKVDEEAFFDLLIRLRQHGSLMFVSHRLSEVLEVSDLIYVLKDGQLVATVDPKQADERTLHGLMVGRERDQDYYHEAEQQVAEARPVAFRTQGLGRAGEFEDVSLEVREGEILGIGGLLKSGKSEFGRSAAGIVAPDAGLVELGGGGLRVPEVRDLISRGLGYVPAERLAEGMILPFSVACNMSMASGQDLFSDRFGVWRSRAEATVAERFIAKLNIRARGPHVPCDTLSGGNQQKVVLARWMCREPRVLILDNPTRGVDAGAKEEIYALIRDLTARDVAVVLITDELLELIGLANRIAVMQNGRVTHIVPAPVDAKPSERQLIELMLSPAAISAGGGSPLRVSAAGAGATAG